MATLTLWWRICGWQRVWEGTALIYRNSDIPHIDYLPPDARDLIAEYGGLDSVRVRSKVLYRNYLDLSVWAKTKDFILF